MGAQLLAFQYEYIITVS